MISRSGLMLVAILSWSVYAQTDYSLPPNSGAINVWDLGARGDDNIDDEKIIEKAIRDNRDGWRQIYLPAGTYYISGTLGDMDSLGGIQGWDRFYTIRGAGPGKTVIRLRDNSTGFQDSANPRPAVLIWNRQELNDRVIPWEGVEEGNPDESNDLHSVQILNLTIDVGNNNPGAIGLDFSAHNGGGVENVEIKAGTNSGKIGLALNRKWPGPSLVNNISITGFDYGIYLRYHNYNMVLEHITLRSQRIVGILHENHAASIRKVHSTNSVPALRNIGLQGMLVLLDCVFEGGAPNVCAIENSDGLFARNIVTKGYQAALKHNGTVVSAFRDTIVEYITESWHCVVDKSPRRSLGLPVKETPQIAWGNPSTWVNIETHQAAAVNDDWSLAIKAAIQAGASTIYLPNKGRYQSYTLKGPVHLNGGLRRIVGLGSALGSHQGRSKIVVDQTDASAVMVLDQVRFDTLEHRSPATLVLKRSFGSNIRTFPNSGDLFIDDICGDNMVFEGSNVWARQLNNEGHSLKIHNKGAKLWVLGYKTENPTTVLINTNGAQTEILGGQNYPVFEVRDTMPMYVNNESALSVIQTYNYYYIPDKPKFPYYVKETNKGTSFRVDSILAPFTTNTRLKRIIYVSNSDSVGSGLPSSVGRSVSRTGQLLRSVVSVKSGRIVVHLGTSLPATIRVFGADGRVVRSLRTDGSRERISIERSGLARGMYCIQILSLEGRQTERLYLR